MAEITAIDVVTSSIYMASVVSCIALVPIYNEKIINTYVRMEQVKIKTNANQTTQFLTDAISSISIISLVTFAYMRTNGIPTSSLYMTTAMCSVALIHICNEIKIISK